MSRTCPKRAVHPWFTNRCQLERLCPFSLSFVPVRHGKLGTEFLYKKESLCHRKWHQKTEGKLCQNRDREIKEGREHRTVGEISDQGTVRSRLTGDQGWILDGRNKGRTRRRRTLQGNVRLRSVMLSMVHCPPPRLNRPDVWDGCVGSILSVLSTCYSYFIYNLIESVGSDSTRPNLGLGRLGEILHGLGLEGMIGSHSSWRIWGDLMIDSS